MLPLALAFVASAQAESYALADAGVTLDLPAGWEMTRWSDWDFKGRTADGAVAIEAWTTPYQVAVEKPTAERWAGAYAEKLAAMRAQNVVRDSVEVGEVAGRKTARTKMVFSMEKGGPRGAMAVGAFAVEGQIFHVATFAVGPNVGKAERALDTLLARLSVQKAPADLAALGGTVETELGFSATLPDGWRRPLPTEEKEALGVLGAVGIGPRDPAACLRAIHPTGAAAADLMLFCGEDWALGIVDANSFVDQERLLKERLFGKAAEKVPAADRIERQDRLGYVLAPEINGHDLRIGVLPYDRGTVVAWAVGEPGSGDTLGSTLRATAASLAFSGPDDGAPVHPTGEWVSHTLTYDPFHPAVLGCGGLIAGVLGGLGWLITRKPTAPPAV